MFLEKKLLRINVLFVTSRSDGHTHRWIQKVVDLSKAGNEADFCGPSNLGLTTTQPWLSKK